MSDLARSLVDAAAEAVEFDRLRRFALLAEKARDAVRTGTRDTWRLSELGYPRLVGVESLAKIAPTADGHGYVVRLYTLRGEEIVACVRKTLPGAFSTGERLLREGR